MKYLMTFSESVNFIDKVMDRPAHGDGFGKTGDTFSKLKIDGNDVGTLHYRIEESCFHVIWLDIRDEYRGNKYGHLLMMEIIKRAKEFKCKSIKLEVLNSNTIAINLYKKYGFRIDSNDTHFYEMVLDL